MMLATESRFDDPDAAYRQIAQAVRPFDREASERFLAALCLTLANQIGNPDVLAEAITLARRAAKPGVAQPAAAQPDKEDQASETS